MMGFVRFFPFYFNQFYIDISGQTRFYFSLYWIWTQRTTKKNLSPQFIVNINSLIMHFHTYEVAKNTPQIEPTNSINTIIIIIHNGQCRALSHHVIYLRLQTKINNFFMQNPLKSVTNFEFRRVILFIVLFFFDNVGSSFNTFGFWSMWLSHKPFLNFFCFFFCSLLFTLLAMSKFLKITTSLCFGSFGRQKST